MSSIRAKQNLKGKLNNAIIYKYPELEDLTVTPSMKEQHFKSEKYGYDNVTVGAIESDSIIIQPSSEEQIYEGVFNKVVVEGNTNINNNAAVENPFSTTSFDIKKWIKVLNKVDIAGVTSLLNAFNTMEMLEIVSIKNSDSVTNYNSFCKNSPQIISVTSEKSLKGTNYNEAFRNCKALVEIPDISGEKVSNNANYNGFYYMFDNCPNLSKESLQKILDMCISATQITQNKNLSFIGLTSIQKTQCTTLSNYQAFLDAGWTLS